MARPATTPDRPKQAKTQVFAWQGWRLELPSRWNPIKLEGDFDKGFALFVDLHRPRLGVRWQRPARAERLDAEQWAKRAISAEVGEKAAGESVPMPIEPVQDWRGARVYLDDDPPGRDIFTAQSTGSGRVIEIVHHAHRRERVLIDAIVPSLAEMPSAEPRWWSVFDLSCCVPGGFTLKTHRLNAGDLTLTFVSKTDELVVRQLAPASLALTRQPLAKWLEQHQHARRSHYRPAGELTLSDGESRVDRTLRRRRRYRFAWRMPRQIVSRAWVDLERDRLVIVDATTPGILDAVAPTIGGVE